MKCAKCSTENITKANYCRSCKYHFSKEEQQKARSKTLVGKIELLEKYKNIVTLNIITDNIIFKILLLLIVLIIGLNCYFKYGNSIKILNSDTYKIKYNTKEKEYYLITDNNTININLYIPNKTKDLVIKTYSSDNKEISETLYNTNITLNVSTSNYYILETKNNKEKLKFYVYKENN